GEDGVAVAGGERGGGGVGAVGGGRRGGGEVGVAGQLASLIGQPREGGDVEWREALPRRLLGRVQRRPHHRGRARERLGFLVALAEVQADEGRHVRRDVLAALVRLSLHHAGGAVGREQGERRHQGERHECS